MYSTLSGFSDGHQCGDVKGEGNERKTVWAVGLIMGELCLCCVVFGLCLVWFVFGLVVSNNNFSWTVLYYVAYDKKKEKEQEKKRKGTGKMSKIRVGLAGTERFGTAYSNTEGWREGGRE